MLTGKIFMTSNLDQVYNRPMNEKVIVINMDEDNKLSQKIPDCIEGLCLLPPVEAMIAEVDGDEVKYNSLYLTHLFNQQDFMSAIIAFLYKGGNALIYLPDSFTYTKQKLLEFIFTVYGIHIGDLEDPANSQCFYNLQSVPFWLNILYIRDLISYLDWLRMMPLDAYDQQGILGGNPESFMKVMYEFNPYTDDPNKKAELVKEFHQKIHKNNKLRPAIIGI
jgi:hypothetical protein